MWIIDPKIRNWNADGARRRFKKAITEAALPMLKLDYG